MTVVCGEALEIVTEGDSQPKVVGVRLKDGSLLSCRAAIVTSGTFMGGLMFCGEERTQGGRFGDKASVGLSGSIAKVGHSLKRLKTGTPARLKAKSIDFSKWEAQWGDPERRTFSWQSSQVPKLPQLSCYLGYTSERTHDVIRANFDKSPLYSGDIVGVGPRYCPSIEDKVRRFAERDRHQIFLEPESLDADSIYPNGMSTCLPADVQLMFLKTISGLENVEFVRPGYAVEYDVFDTQEMTYGFQSRYCSGLYLAGQVNRTSGYEEAASQGLWAGINASRQLQGKEELRPDRSRSYIETLVDDLVSKGTEEPYRMFTSRSEFRLLLREDNAHERLFELGRANGIVSDAQARWLETLIENTRQLKETFSKERIRLDADRVISLFEYLKRPEVSWENLAVELPSCPDDLALEKMEIDAKYSGYLNKQMAELREYQDIQSWHLRADYDVHSIPALSSEVIEKVLKHQPRSVAELASLSGITPSAVLAIARAAGIRNVSRETRI